MSVYIHARGRGDVSHLRFFDADDRSIYICVRVYAERG